MEWQVEIISMSFGLSDETEQGCDELTRAIVAARAHGILMFAAASNSGAHSAPAFPARHSNVFCIYAGDGMGNSGPTNPTARRRSYNFCTLGEAVKSAWPRALSVNPWKCRKSGTSFSTPIAAGIAAFVLLYARQNMVPDEAERFKQYDKMRDMLVQMSNRRHGYDVISISNFFARPPDERRLLMKNVLAGTPWKT
jgi:Subtilase family